MTMRFVVKTLLAISLLATATACSQGKDSSTTSQQLNCNLSSMSEPTDQRAYAAMVEDPIKPCVKAGKLKVEEAKKYMLAQKQRLNLENPTKTMRFDAWVKANNISE